jgi:hypothetical protein
MTGALTAAASYSPRMLRPLPHSPDRQAPGKRNQATATSQGSAEDGGRGPCQYNVSRSSVSRAAVKLADEGLVVVVVDRRGVFIPEARWTS